MKNKFRTKVIISSVITLLPMLTGLILWNNLPELLTTHWGFDGHADGWHGRGMAVFVLPLILLAGHWLCIFVTSKDPKNKNFEGKSLNLIFWLIPVISNYAFALIYSTAFGKNWDQHMILFLLFGVLFMVIGNYLPKTRQNYTMGIKVPWALNNEENWNATHRFGGKVWVIGGVLFLFASLLPEELTPFVLLVLVLILALVPTLYSYLYYKKQLRAGTATKEDAKLIPKGTSKKTAYISLIIILLVFVLVAVLMFTGDIEVIFDEDSFTVKADYYGDLTVKYEAVDSIEYLESHSSGLRQNGYGSARLGMGMFKSEALGTYTRYCYTKCPAAVMLEVEGKTLLINGIDEAATMEIYNLLLDKCGK